MFAGSSCVPETTNELTARDFVSSLARQVARQKRINLLPFELTPNATGLAT
mgnify:FL=1